MLYSASLFLIIAIIAAIFVFWWSCRGRSGHSENPVLYLSSEIHHNLGRQSRCPAKAADLVNRRADRGQLGVDEPLPAVAQAGAHGFQSIALGPSFRGATVLACARQAGGGNRPIQCRAMSSRRQIQTRSCVRMYSMNRIKAFARPGWPVSRMCSPTDIMRGQSAPSS